MGQGCTKATQQSVSNGAYKAPDSAPKRPHAAAAFADALEQQQHRGASQVWQSVYGLGGRYTAGVRRQVQHPLIDRIISSLNAQELNSLMVINAIIANTVSHW